MSVLLICAVLLVGCLTMSPHHPIDGRWERVEGKLMLPMLLEFEPSGAVTGDGTMHGRFALAEPHRIALSFQQYAWKGTVGIGTTLTLTDAQGERTVYRRVSFCSSEMGTPCPYD